MVSNDSIDVTQIEVDALSQEPFPGPQPFRVYIEEETHWAIWDHARSTVRDGTLREVGGVLIGDVYRDHAGPYLSVTASIVAEHTRSEGTELAFTPESWDQINRAKDASYADQRIVGWYHTHPSFGIFLSERDKFVHRHSFPQPWAVAYVLDPVQDHEGVFAWTSGEPIRVTEHWTGRVRRVAPPQIAMEEIGDAVDEPPVSRRLSRLALPAGIVIAAIGLAAAFGLLRRQETRMVEEIGVIIRALESERLEANRTAQSLGVLEEALVGRGVEYLGGNDTVRTHLRRAQVGVHQIDSINRALLARLSGSSGEPGETDREGPDPEPSD